MKNLLYIPLLFICLSSMAQLDKPSGLAVGTEAPDFTAVNVVDGDEISLSNYLERGAVLLVFYRGEWCKYCNQHLSEIEEWREEIEAAGITIITVSPQTSENVKKTIDHTDASYIMVSDDGFKIMKAYDVDFTLDDDILKKYKNWNIDIDSANGDTSNTMTVPATYLVGQDGKVIYTHFDENYKERSSIEKVMEAYHESAEGEKKIQDLRTKSKERK